MKAFKNKGFTLAELLIVMAIVVVLASVAVPTFNKQLETSRETNDMEIIRNAYTEAMSAAILDAADGVINGAIGDKTVGETATWTGDKLTNSGGVTYVSGGKYKVILNGDNSITPKAYFKQAKVSESDAGEWKYVPTTFMNRNLPVVNTTMKTLTFTFEIKDGNVQLVEDKAAAGETAAVEAIVAAAS